MKKGNLTQVILEQALSIFLMDLKAAGRSSSTIRFYQREVALFSRFLGASPLHASPDDLRRYFVHLRDLRNAHGLAAAWRALRAFYNWAAREGFIPESPMRALTPPRPPQDVLPAIPEEHIKKMLAAAASWRDRAIILVLLDTGLRASELLRLRIKDVDLESGVIIVRGKGGHAAPVYLGNRSRAALTRYLALERQNPQPDEPLFVSARGGPLAYRSLLEVIARLSVRAGIPRYSPHAFRRTFALRMLEAGVSVFVLQRLMRLRSLDVLRRYLPLTPEHARAALEQAGHPGDRL
jgi:site-specific recombinase XerD